MSGIHWTCSVAGAVCATTLAVAPPSGLSRPTTATFAHVLAPRAGPPACSAALFVGLRGSGEPLTEYAGMGGFPDAVFKTVGGGGGTAEYGLPYDASRPSDKSAENAQRAVDDGVVLLRRFVAERSAACPREKLVLVGFSLGAQVLGDALPSLTPGTLSAVVLFADPFFNPHDTLTAAGSFVAAFGGDRGQRAPYPALLSARIRSYCRSGDIICQRGAPGASKTEHGRYAPEQVCAAALFIADRISLSPPRCP